MKYLAVLILMIASFPAPGQEGGSFISGSVSYVSSGNVYVKFESTAGIEQGDTLYRKLNAESKPVLIVQSKSSISCIGSLLDPGDKIAVGDELFWRHRPAEKTIGINEAVITENNLLNPENQHPAENNESNEQQKDIARGGDKMAQDGSSRKGSLFDEHINGKVSVSSYNNFSGSRKTNVMKYTFSFRGDHLKNSGFSVESYISLRQKLDDWNEVRSNIFNGLKIYSLAIGYDFSQKSGLKLGRRINPRISSLGAIDGIHLETGKGNFLIGMLAGFRPDYQDYGFNFKLPQYGIYVGHESRKNGRFSQTTIGFIDQRNNGEIDRRFVYFQHSGSLLSNLYMFTSAEISLFEKINGESRNTVNLDNLYILFRYRLSEKISLSTAYDNRKNQIYYESYKNFIDSLMDRETRHGIRFQLNYRPNKNLMTGISTNRRFQQDKLNKAENISFYLGMNKVPALNIRAFLTADFLRTNYISTLNFGIRFSREIITGRLSGDIYYRNVNYQYTASEARIKQNILGCNVSFRILSHLNFYMIYEGALDNEQQLINRLNASVIQRF